MDINRALAHMQDDDDEIPQAPSAPSVRLDTFFEDDDYGIPEAPVDELTMQLPLGKVVKVSRRRLKNCVTSEQLRQLDRELYASAGLDPRAYGL